MSREFLASKLKKYWRSPNKRLLLVIASIFTVFFGIFIYKSFNTMKTTPFYEFDEAHRVENAKRMREYRSLIPLTGSSFDRDYDLRIPLKNDKFSFLYFHVERPPLVYLLMVVTTKIFGSTEWAYRLPSFILGMGIFVVFLYFSKKIPKYFNIIALGIGLLCLISSSDLWLSSQYAQLDTGLAVFLFLALLSLIHYLENKKSVYLTISGISLGLAILCKGQPAIIFTLPLIYLLITKKISLKEIRRLIIITLITILPWILYVNIKFGVINFVEDFFGFAVNSAANNEIQHVAPFFWYIRWLWETLRPGWTLFLALLATDFINKSLNWKKLTILTYIIGSLVIYSIPQNKIWWYILPLEPAIAFYIYLETTDLLKKRADLLLNLSLIIIFLARPPFSASANRIALFYGIILTIASTYILNYLYSVKVNVKIKEIILTPTLLFLIILVYGLFSYNLRFPQIVPYNWNLKPASIYFSFLPRPKCLWIYNLPPESIIFYSDVGEVHTLNGDTKLFGHCTNYLITSEMVRDLPKLSFQYTKIVFQQGDIKLFELHQN